MNAIMERWTGSARCDILDRILLVNAAHLRQVLAEHEDHFNAHRPNSALRARCDRCLVRATLTSRSSGGTASAG
jgi:hypothetical protein